MKASETTYKIQPEILTSMRQLSGMTEEDIAKKLKLTKAKYLDIETGKNPVNQNLLLELADIYKRPLIAFYSSEIISAPQLPHDYRLNRDKKISPEVYLAKRKAIYLSEQLKEVTDRNTNLPEIDKKATPVELANHIRGLLEVDFSLIKEVIETKTDTALGFYKSIIEENFFIPVVEHPLKTNGVRAFSVFGEVCVIILNESDSREVKLFSLFHELCHLLKRQEGICSIDFENKLNTLPEERFCDDFSASFLMPEKELNKSIKEPILNLIQIDKIAKSFGVSKQVTLIRLKEFSILDSKTYKKLKLKLESLTPSKFGRRNWERTYINRTSRLVLNNLVKAYNKGDLTYTSLSTITGIKDKYLQKLI